MEHKYLTTKEQYLSTKSSWASSQPHAAWHHIVYNILRDKPARHGFAEKKKRIEGNDPWFGFNHARSEAIYALYTLSQTPRPGAAEHFKTIFGIDLPDNLRDTLINT